MTRKTQRRIRRWFNGRTVAAILAVLVVVVGAGLIFGWWASLWQGLFGTAGPAGGYSCLPTCDEVDGKFLSMPGEDMYSFGGESIYVWISVPAGQGQFELGIFDGDSGKDNNGNINFTKGNWDNTTTESAYTLYADPWKDGSGKAQLGQWHGNGDPMPNNAWFDITLDNSSQALDPAGTYYVYRLECTRPVQGYGINALKLRSTGFLTTGQGDLVNAAFAIVGMLGTVPDVQIIFPDFTGDFNNPGQPRYTGDWQFYFKLPTDQTTLELWDGDFDRGSYNLAAADTDDPNTEGVPPWASSFAVPERAAGRGNPADDSRDPLVRISPPVWYEILDPEGQPIYSNGEPGNPNEPSGTEEWENFVLSTDASRAPDMATQPLAAGEYTWHIVGLDIHNTVWIRTNVEICPVGECPDDNPHTCPRTIGYWKNNVKKILIENKTKGVQETRASLEHALDLIALASPLYRSGLNVAAPAPVDNPVRLTDQEAHAILQKAAGNSMLDRALQQNLATWLNLASGKIDKTTYITLNWGGGGFEGTAWEALQEAQNIILYGGDLERAKNIADQINNGLLGEEADGSSCEDYTQVVPPDKQPPDKDHMPKGPKPDVQPPAPAGCDGPRVNTYGVESPTNNPFYGIKFEYQSGTEVKDGAYDEFQIVLPTDVVAGLTAVQMEAKAGQNEGQATLQGCQFDQFVACETVAQDGSGFFEFSFQGARDNGDGTMTLVFWVTNMTGSGLSHATIGLPDGVVPLSPTGSYQSQVCP